LLLLPQALWYRRELKKNVKQTLGPGLCRMILPRLRTNLDFMPSPVIDRPGLLIRDSFRYSDATLIIPPLLVYGLEFFDGTRTELELHAELTRLAESSEIGDISRLMAGALSEAGFLEDETYANLKQVRHRAFAESPVRQAAFAGSAYPRDIESLRKVMQHYLIGVGSTLKGVMGIAAPHVSPEGGWQSYRAAYQSLAPDLRDRTFVVLGTSHYGQPDKFGLTRKPFETPFGRTGIDDALVSELETQPAVLMEDYCHAVEHSIEFQVLFLQAIYGPEVRILPVLCGSFGRSIENGGLPEDDDSVKRFLGTLGEIAEREKGRLFWVLGVDMAHMGERYGDSFAAHADRNEMTVVRERDLQRIERISAADARGFWHLIKENQDDLKWCGSSPLYTFMKAVPKAQGTLHRYEQWNIGEGSVVSFGGISFAS
jgi:MEMO1 family protein